MTVTDHRLPNVERLFKPENYFPPQRASSNRRKNQPWENYIKAVKPLDQLTARCWKRAGKEHCPPEVYVG